MAGLYERLHNDNRKYSESFVRLLIKAGRKRKEFPKKFKEVIFYMCKDFILKNVNNFKRINKYRGDKAPFDEEDAILECYLVMEYCIEKFKLELGKNFFFYYNRSLTTRLTRVANYRWVYHPDHRVVSMDLEIDEEGHDFGDLLADENANDAVMQLMIQKDIEALNIDGIDFDMIYQKGVDNSKKVEVQKLKERLKKHYDEQ